MSAVTEDIRLRSAGDASMRARRWGNMAVFLGPALLVILTFYIVPVLVDLVVAFTDLGRDLKISEFSTRNFERAFTGDRRLPGVIGLTTFYVFGTLAMFHLTLGLVLALTTTAVPGKSGTFFRAVWLLPRMSPSVVYIVLWNWSVHSGETSLVNQVLINVFNFDEPVDLLLNNPVALIVLSNGFIGASFGMIILTSAIRGIPEHLFHAARVDGAGYFSVVRHVTLPALRWPLTYIAIWQTLSLFVSFEYIILLTGGGPFQDTTVFSLYIYRRAFESGQYGYGAALALFLIVPGIIFALATWRFTKMQTLMQEPRIEVQ